jgi:hypothetical protein
MMRRVLGMVAAALLLAAAPRAFAHHSFTAAYEAG